MTTRLLTAREAEQKIGITPISFWRGVRAGTFPQPIRLGPRQPRWREDEIDAVIERLTAERDAEAGQ